jgi:hypothetical protein
MERWREDLLLSPVPLAGQNLRYESRRITFTRKHIGITLILCITSAFVGVVLAQGSIVNIDPRRHGKLAAAQKYIVQAFEKLDQAQQANEDQLGGHAQRAKDLLVQADGEIRLAADVANEHRR